MIGIKVDSKVSDQPFKDEEIKDSMNRPKNALKLVLILELVLKAA